MAERIVTNGSLWQKLHTPFMYSGDVLCNKQWNLGTAYRADEIYKCKILHLDFRDSVLIIEHSVDCTFADDVGVLNRMPYSKNSLVKVLHNQSGFIGYMPKVYLVGGIWWKRVL